LLFANYEIVINILTDAEKEKVQLASHVLQFVFLGHPGFRFPLAHWPTKEVDPATLYIHFWKSVYRLLQGGFSVHYCCCDGESANRSFIKPHFSGLDPYDEKSTLIVRAAHCMVLLGGVRETLTELRQSYWIPKGRQLVKTEIRKCVTCRKVEGPPFRSVHSPPLPDIRVTGSQPFQVTGIDYAGPLYVRNANKEVSKVYICLFTCTAIRAVHLN